MSASAGPSPGPTLSERLGIRPAIVELGSTHSAVRRVLAGAGSTASFLVTLDDDRIEAVEVEIGHGHRGFEKEVESRPWLAGLPYVTRLGYAAGAIAQVGYCLALERLVGLEVADVVTWQRTLVCELARVTDHLARVAGLCAAIGASAAERVAQAAELVAADSLGRAIGGRPLDVWTLPGRLVPTAGRFAERWPEDRARLASSVDRLAALLLDHPVAAARLVDVAPLTPAVAAAFAVTGPCLRAAGVARDLRRDAPLLAYGELDFDVPIGTRGDDCDRLAVVLEETRQGLWIADQCSERLAILAEASAGQPGPASPTGPELGAGGADEAALVVPPGEVELSLESSTGELGFLLVSDGGPVPRRVRCRAPSFFHAQVLPAVLLGARLDDLLPTAALFHLVGPEHDR